MKVFAWYHLVIMCLNWKVLLGIKNVSWKIVYISYIIKYAYYQFDYMTVLSFLFVTHVHRGFQSLVNTISFDFQSIHAVLKNKINF